MCSFNLTSVESAFSGPFKTREDPDSIWRPEDADHSHFRCAGGSEDHLQINSKDYQLMDSAVQPSRGEPVYRVRHYQLCTYVPTIFISEKS